MSRSIILLLTGPNLDLLGQRDPAKYGTASLEDHVSTARGAAAKNGFELEHLQTAVESEMVTAIHGARGRVAAIVINAGAFTHYAWAVRDALELFKGPIIELHVSNPGARENWRHVSVITPVATGAISGLGLLGYELAVEAAGRKVLSQGPQHGGVVAL